MNRCNCPDHPHCTLWVAPGETACAHGHAQAAAAAGEAAAEAASSFDMLTRLRAASAAADAIRPHVATPATPAAAAALPAPRPYLHISGFDPRAAGGRQAIKLELRGMPDGCPAELTVLLKSELLAPDGGRQQFVRTLRGDWRPLFLEFSSRGREHGQYRIDVELHAPAQARTWVATLVLLVPRPDASLGEIHETYLATHKNVRINADDASIARLHGLAAAGSMDIDIQARNGAIAQLNLDNGAGGKVDVALPTIAWDEDLIEIDRPAAQPDDPAADAVADAVADASAHSGAHPFPADRACLVHAEPDAGAQRHVRLFALDECVLGRHDADAAGHTEGAEADLLLAHYGEHGPERAGLTRRLSARHALIRPARDGFEIEDVSRYGLLVDGAWPGKHAPVQLRLGMRIELTASIRGIVTLVVSALYPHALVLHRVDAGGAAEAFVLMVPDVEPAPAPASTSGAMPRAAMLPVLFHRGGGFWHRDPASGKDTPLTPATPLDRLARFNGLVRFAGSPRPEDFSGDASGDRRRDAASGRLLGA
jgi:hypothetical protein